MDGVELDPKRLWVGEDVVVEIVEVEKWERGRRSGAGLSRRGAGISGRKLSSGS